jgi:hypothetical protein
MSISGAPRHRAAITIPDQNRSTRAKIAAAVARIRESQVFRWLDDASILRDMSLGDRAPDDNRSALPSPTAHRS